MLKILALYYKCSSTVFAGWISFKPGLIDVSCPTLDQIYICCQPGLRALTSCDYSSLYDRVRITVIVENDELCQGIGLLRDAIPTDKDIIQLFEKFTLQSVQETISQWSQVCIRNHYNPNSCHLYNTQLNFTFREQVISPSFGKMSSY